MKNKKTTKIILLSLVVVTSILSSCRKKDDDEVRDSDVSAALDQSLASSIVNDMTNISDEACRTANISSFRVLEANTLLSACTTLSFDTLLSAKTITVNFGSANCLCNDGRNRRGKLLISFTGKYRDSLTVITVTPQNYFVNDNQVAGSKTITNKGRNASNNLVYEVKANIIVSKANNGGTINWQSTRQREWITGENTLTWADDIYSITGNASGLTSNGGTFISVITSPLIRNMAVGCRKSFTSGVLEHTPSGKATRYINFGNGACDNQAVVTINGNQFTINLP